MISIFTRYGCTFRCKKIEKCRVRWMDQQKITTMPEYVWAPNYWNQSGALYNDQHGVEYILQQKKFYRKIGENRYEDVNKNGFGRSLVFVKHVVGLMFEKTEKGLSASIHREGAKQRMCATVAITEVCGVRYSSIIIAEEFNDGEKPLRISIMIFELRGEKDKKIYHEQMESTGDHTEAVQLINDYIGRYIPT